MQRVRSKNLSKLNRDAAPRVRLALDVGTTGVKAFVFGDDERVLSRAYEPLRKYFPKRGWVEQDPQEIVSAAKKALRAALSLYGAPLNAGASMGIANQRETAILWNRHTGFPIYPAIVWEDARTKAECERLETIHGKNILGKTGLPVDAYFSASKIAWMLRNVSGARGQAERGELCFGTVDSWLLRHLAEGHPHRTDYTNASRTLLFNIHKKEWDSELLSIFGIPETVLSDVFPSASHFGVLSEDVCGARIPILGVLGDQQASLFAAGTESGTTKITFGTGIFIMQIIGEDWMIHPPFFTTLAVGKGERPLFALEAKIESCAKRVTPLIGRAPELNALLDAFASRVAGFVAQLPLRPKELIIDGGVTQASHLAEAIRRATGLPVREHAIFDGTALGIARITRHQRAVLY